MSVFEKILHALQFHGDAPTNYGLFHICFLVLTLAVTIFLVWRFKNASDKTVRKILLAFWITVVVFEIYKQLDFSMVVTDGVANWSYQWYALPFQFCSTIFYTLPFIIFLPDGWLRKAFIAFFTTFTFFAGFAVMLYPGDVFSPDIGVSVQTMIHHGTQVALGIFLTAHSLKNVKFRHLGIALAIFYVFCGIAMILNESVHNLIVAGEIVGEFNMFFISPYYNCTLPILADIYKAVPYPAFLAIYMVGFALIALLFFAIEKGILALVGKCKKAPVEPTVEQ